MWTDLQRPIVIAHRGDKAHAPENTLAAFTLAADKGADAIELDVKLSADGEVMVLHDKTVDRTTNGTGKISKLSYAKLHSLDAGKWFSGNFEGECIPSLEQVFEGVGKKVYINIELTNYATPSDGLVLKVVELVKKHAMEERVLFSSFLVGNLQRATHLLPAVPRGLLVLPGWMGIWGRSIAWRADYFALHPNLAETNLGLVNRVHAAGKWVNVWTVNRPEDIKKMIGLGVDAIFTDDPGQALRLLGRSQ